MKEPIVENAPIWTEESALIRDPRSLTRGVRNPLHYSLGERLKKARIAAGIQPTILSIQIGLSRTTVHYIERGRVPGVDVLEKLARGLRCSPCTLAFGVQVPYEEQPADAPLRCLGLGERLRTMREFSSLSMRALGREASLTPTAIGNIEAGKVLPGVDVAEALAQALRISPCWLAWGESEPDGPRWPPPIKKKKPEPAPRRASRRSSAAATTSPRRRP